jgi:RNA-directed DNA polymerase
MATVPSDLAKFLSVKTPSGLAKVLCGSPYRQLSRLIYPSPKYVEFSIKKKNGADRQIAVPSRLLMGVQKRLARILQDAAKVKPSAHGFVKKKSIVSNAEAHAGERKTFVFNIDLKDFFPSITFYRVRGVFMSPPFVFPHAVATVLAHLCTWKGVLPQGAPTSPVLSNLVCRGLDGDLQKLAHECRATYTRYVDDITFSFSEKSKKYLPERIVRVSGDTYSVGESLAQIVGVHSFLIHPDKVRLNSIHGRMEVTGLTVNEFPNVRRSFVHEIRGMLHAWEKHGLKNAELAFSTKKTCRRQLRSKEVPSFGRVVWGKLLYIKMVKKEFDSIYIRLAKRYNNLCARDSKVAKYVLPKLPVPDAVLAEGDLEKAVYVVECFDPQANYSQGTAFFLAGVGIVTCEHVIRHPDSVVASKSYVYFRDGIGGEIKLKSPAGAEVCDVEIVYANRYADLAVLRPVGSISAPPLILAPETSQVKSGDEVCVVGYPDHKYSKSLSCDWGGVLTPFAKNGFRHFDVKPLIRVGNSGGPVVTEKLRVAGMAKEGVKQEGGENAVLCIHDLMKIFENGIKSVSALAK